MLVLIPLAACQNLSNSKASDLIKKSDKWKTISIYTNYMNYSGYKGNVLYYDLEKLKKLQELGYVNILINLGDHSIVNFTDKAKEYLDVKASFIGAADVHLILGNIEDIEVTGIEEISENSKKAHFEATYKPNEIGSILENQSFFIKSGKEQFVKFDDGWRLSQ